jgi:hypothetical protein
MKVFSSFNDHGGTVCPICGKGTPEKTILLPIVGTEKDNIMEARQVHLDCLDLSCKIDNDVLMIFQFVSMKGCNDDKETFGNID